MLRVSRAECSQRGSTRLLKKCSLGRMLLADAFIGDLGNFITGIATAVLALGAAYTARSALRERRGRWLMDLRLTMVDREAFQTVREQLYHEIKCPGSSKLCAALRHRRSEAATALSAKQTKLLVALDDYLDFFDLIEHLIANGELGLKEADDMFSWYVSEPLRVPLIASEVDEAFTAVRELNNAFDRIHELEACGRGREIKRFSKDYRKKRRS